MEFFIILLTALLPWVVTISAQPAKYRGSPYKSEPRPAPIGHDGRVVDTPEVAQAKANHLIAFSRLGNSAPATARSYGKITAPAASVAAAYNGPVGAYSNPSYFSSRIQHGPYDYRGPPAPLDHEGRVVDTPEVRRAKSAHFAAYNAAPAAVNTYSGNESGSAEDNGDYRPGSYSDDDESGSAEGYSGSSEGGASQQYQGPLAPLAEDGRVVDTPEVRRAKAEHLEALRKAQAQAASRQSYSPRTSGYYNNDY